MTKKRMLTLLRRHAKKNGQTFRLSNCWCCKDHKHYGFVKRNASMETFIEQVQTIEQWFIELALQEPKDVT